MFRGSNSISVDEKGRLTMPSRYREALRLQANDQLIATIDPDERCLLLYPLPEWEEIEEKIASLPSFNSTARKIQRLLIGHAIELVLDTNSRILLPQTLREYANLDKHVMLLGQGKKFEIWNENYWQEQCNAWLQEDIVTKQGLLPENLKLLSL